MKRRMLGTWVLVVLAAGGCRALLYTPCLGRAGEGLYCQNHVQCAPLHWVCDGVTQCSDGSDEQDCPNTRKATLLHSNLTGYRQCLTGPRISARWVCDGAPDCPDASDEKKCLNSTNPSSLTCPFERGVSSSGRTCIFSQECRPVRDLCDKHRDCKDHSDEIYCHYTACNMGYVHCPSGVCILWNKVCDGKQDCADGGDERHCGEAGQECPHPLGDGVRCSGSNKCISRSWLCDRFPDCGLDDFSDESDCPRPGAGTTPTLPTVILTSTSSHPAEYFNHTVPVPKTVGLSHANSSSDRPGSSSQPYDDMTSPTSVPNQESLSHLIIICLISMVFIILIMLTAGIFILKFILAQERKKLVTLNSVRMDKLIEHD